MTLFKVPFSWLELRSGDAFVSADTKEEAYAMARQDTDGMVSGIPDNQTTLLDISNIIIGGSILPGAIAEREQGLFIDRVVKKLQSGQYKEAAEGILEEIRSVADDRGDKETFEQIDEILGKVFDIPHVYNQHHYGK